MAQNHHPHLPNAIRARMAQFSTFSGAVSRVQYPEEGRPSDIQMPASDHLGHTHRVPSYSLGPHNCRAGLRGQVGQPLFHRWRHLCRVCAILSRHQTASLLNS